MIHDCLRKLGAEVERGAVKEEKVRIITGTKRPPYGTVIGRLSIPLLQGPPGSLVLRVGDSPDKALVNFFNNHRGNIGKETEGMARRMVKEVCRQEQERLERD